MLTSRFMPDDKRADDAARVRGWVEEALHLTEGALVFVTELECMEEGCPPLETVIVVSRGAKDRVQYKVARPTAEVTREDVSRVITAGRESCAHGTTD